jgi:hypothetical protein
MEADDVQSDFSFSFVFPRDDATGKDKAYCVAVPERALCFENMFPLVFTFYHKHFVETATKICQQAWHKTVTYHVTLTEGRRFR